MKPHGRSLRAGGSFLPLALEKKLLCLRAGEAGPAVPADEEIPG